MIYFKRLSGDLIENWIHYVIEILEAATERSYR